MNKKRVICNKEDYIYFTLGNDYELEDEGNSSFYRKDDDGDVCYYPNCDFSVVEEELKFSFIQCIKNVINE